MQIFFEFFLSFLLTNVIFVSILATTYNNHPIIIKMIKKEFIDNMLISKSIWEYLNTLREEKWITYKELEDKVWLSHTYILNTFNWRSKWNFENFEKIAINLWVSKSDFESFVRKTINKINNWWDNQNHNLLEDIDFDVALRKEYWKELSESSIQRIREFIEFVKNK